MTFSARFIANIIAFARQQGADQKVLLAYAGKDWEALQDENLRFDSSTYNNILEKALEITGDHLLGLHMGEFLSLSASGLVVQIVQSSGTVKEALKHICHFANLGCRALPYVLEEQQDAYSLSISPDPTWILESRVSVEQTIDGIMAYTRRQFEALTLEKYQPLAIQFARKEPQNWTEYQSVLKCPVQFDQKQNAILFRKSYVEEKIISSDYRLLQILVQHANERLQTIEKEVGFIAQVKQLMIQLMDADFPDIEKVAGNLNISVRTFQRRLKEEGSTFKSLVNDLREAFAKRYLANHKLTIKEIAYLLNYSEPSAFNRSFRKWTGLSPKEYRKEKLN